ncbi:tetratricopeptide repeat protein [Hydrogenothermus marinus]|uniref:Tetratricopeptide repeat protein n=1 Tax=Hydrogenothermus marinus TaxID=133270 RepID=A0A3M0BIH2_9AQUI|nr:hypothetical protein [Hydrogenothermus marinus]RMA96174.1 hypothetical protein CLV39_1191 [Hydrogenothermus marinus]
MKFTVGLINLSQKEKISNETLESLEKNKEYIDKVLYSGKKEDIENFPIDLEVIPLNIESENKAYIRNKILEESKDSQYILWLSNESILEEETLEEYKEVLKEFPDVDIIYPNEILIDFNNEENTRTFNDWYKKEIELLQGITLEKYLPEFGVLTKKEIFEKFGKFDENFEDYEFYRFISLNIKNLKLKLSEFSFIKRKIFQTFIDTSFHSKNLRDIINIYDWKKEIFPNLNWEKEKVAKATAYTIIADRLREYIDLYNATEFYKKALLTFHNQHSLKSLIDTYIQMGDFDKARYMLEEQGLSEKEIKKYKEQIDNIENIVNNLEKAVEEGKAKEVLASIPEVISIYEGAPIYNILGVIHFIGKDIEGSYKYLYKAVSMNPLNEYYKANLLDVAKLLNKTSKVEKLIERILIN